MPWFWCGEVKKSSCELDTWEPQIFFRTVSSPTGFFFMPLTTTWRLANCCRRKSSGFGVHTPDSNTSFHLHGLRCRPENCDATSLPQLLRGLLRCMQRANCRWHCILACHQHPEPSVSELPLDDFESQGHSCAQQQVLAPSSVHIQDTFKNGCSTAS